MIKPDFDFLEFKRKLARDYNLGLDILNDLIKDAENCKKRVLNVISLLNKKYTVTKTGIGPILTKYGRFFQMTFKINNDERYNLLTNIKRIDL